MLQERVEGKWVASFRRFLVLNGISEGTEVAIVCETQSRPVLLELCELALFDLGSVFSAIRLPTPPQTAPVPVKSTGASNAIAGMTHVIEALKRVEVILDITVEGLIHAEEWPEIEAAGARLVVICNEHPEILERTEPTANLGPKVARGIEMLRDASEMRVTSAAGTDLIIDIQDAPAGVRQALPQHRVASPIGRGLCLAFGRKNDQRTHCYGAWGHEPYVQILS